MLIQKVFSDMEKELRESFEGLDMYFGYSNDNYDISVFDIPDVTIYYAGAKLEVYHDDDINPMQMQFECLNASTKKEINFMNKKTNKSKVDKVAILTLVAAILTLVTAGIFYLKLTYLDSSIGEYIGDSIFMIFMLCLCYSTTKK